MLQMTDIMKSLALLLVFGTVPGYFFVLQPRAAAAPYDFRDEDASPEILEETTRDLTGRLIMESLDGEDGLNLVWNSRNPQTQLQGSTKRWKMLQNPNGGRQEEPKVDQTKEKTRRNDNLEKTRRENVDEERESRLVAGIHLYEETRGGSHGDGLSENEKNLNNKGLEEREKEVLTSRTSSAQVEKEVEMVSLPHNLHHVPPGSPRTPSTVPPAAIVPNPTVSTLEDLLIVLALSSADHLQPNFPLQNPFELKVGSNSKDDMDIFWKPPKTEMDVIHQVPEISTAAQPENESSPNDREATAKPEEEQVTSKDSSSQEPKSTPEPNKLVNFTRKPNTTQITDKPGPVQMVENETKVTAKLNKAALTTRPRLTKPSARLRPTTGKTPAKINNGGKNTTIQKSKEKTGKNENKLQKPPEKKKMAVTTTPTYFPYFMDDYCPPQCACYGRVVQCSDKGVDKVPYGIPYNARYMLLMNNHIDSIQLDLLKEYVSMEFLVLSNNRLTSGAIEGAFEGVPALKRLYLDRNLLESVPTDLPSSLEELRLEDNLLSEMSEAAWTQCPSLLILSLSNNSLGDRSESLPESVLSPLSNLRTLNLNHNHLKMVPLGLPLSIKEMFLKGNLIEQFREGVFIGRSQLVVLDLSGNKLTNKGLHRNSLLNTTVLESLNLEGNKLKQVPRHLPRSLKTLNLEGNLITSVKKSAFGTLKNLEHLGLGRNKIFSVAPGAFKTLPALHQLDLCHNTLLQVPRQLPHALHLVALTHNKIESVPRDAFCWGVKLRSPSGLIRVQLEHNRIDMGTLDTQAFRCLRGFQVVHFY